MDAAAIRERAADLPREPGIYQFRTDEAVLYIGKAVDIRSRVRSYADPRGPRIRRMLREANAIEIAITDTETQALLLEANLIKRHRPRFNVRLTDDKSYPLIQLSNHDFPRIEVTRDPDDDATVFGPYTNKGRVDTVVKALRETYGIRGCSDHKFANRDRPCLDFDLGLCTAPCTGEIDQFAYLDDVDSVLEFLEGSTGVLVEPLRTGMAAAADNHDYERAANLRDRLAAAETFHGGGGDAVQTPDDRRTMDILAVSVQGDRATVARLHSEGGKLLDREQHPLETPGETSPAAVLAAFIPQFYADRDLPDNLVLSHHPEDDEVEEWLAEEGVALSVPGTGREARLVDLALKNARRGAEYEGAPLAEALGFDRIDRIEGFDISHAQGKAVVGSNVTFTNGTPDKSGYRRKKLDDKNDDVANMRALLSWRATRAVEGRDDRPDPDLLLIDGGEAQFAAAREAIQTAGWDVPVVALAKEDEIVISADGRHDWPSKAPHLHLLQRVRDEAHRFAAQYHQTVREDLSTILDNVPGVGRERRNRLLRRFGSVDGVRGASREELLDVDGIGDRTAEAIAARL